jgi:hypothetical protein
LADPGDGGGGDLPGQLRGSSDRREGSGGSNGSEPAVAAGLRLAWRVIVAVVGATVVALGLVLVLTPGPALLVIPIGLAILATEFAWARRWLRKLRAGD